MSLFTRKMLMAAPKYSLTIDMMEYATDGAAQNAWVATTPKAANGVSATFVDEDCSALGSWVDSDGGTGSTTQVTFDTQETFRMTSGATASSANYAETSQDFGSLEGLGSNLVVEIKVYCDAIGTRAGVDIFNLQVQRSDWRLLIDLASDGLFVYDGSSFNEVGTNLVIQDTWQTWTFDIDLSAGVASAVCDVYLGGVLQASDVDCSATGVYTDGLVQLDQAGTTTTNRVTYIDYIKIGTDFLPSLQSYSEPTIKTQGEYALKLSATTDALGETVVKTLTGGDILDLTGKNTIKFDVRSTGTGSNLQASIHDSGGTTSTHAVNISSADTYQTENWDISAISNANKDAIDSIDFEILNAGSARTFYIDNLYAE